MHEIILVCGVARVKLFLVGVSDMDENIFSVGVGCEIFLVLVCGVKIFWCGVWRA